MESEPTPQSLSPLQAGILAYKDKLPTAIKLSLEAFLRIKQHTTLQEVFDKLQGMLLKVGPGLLHARVYVIWEELGDLLDADRAAGFGPQSSPERSGIIENDLRGGVGLGQIDASGNDGQSQAATAAGIAEPLH
jgi:hypothetical protein